MSDECATCIPSPDICPDQPPATPIGHRCRRANRCADGEPIRCPDCNTRWARAGAEIGPYDGLCGQCTTDVGIAVRGLGLDYAELHLALGRTGRSPSDWGGERVRGSAEPPIPIAAHLEALQRDIVEHATRWAAVVADELGLNRHSLDPTERIVHRHAETLTRLRTCGARRLYDLGDRARAAAIAAARADLVRITEVELGEERGDRYDDGRPTVRLGHAVRLLTNAVGPLLALPRQEFYTGDGFETIDGISAGLQLLALHEQVRAACGRAELVHHLPTPCPSCGVRALLRDNGDDKVRCGACHHEWNEDGYQWFTRVATYAYAA
jgi:hypothetical protein